MSYYTKITTAGLAAITAAMNNSSKVPITYMAFGDGNGYIPEPDENATSLVNEVYRVGVNKVEVHSKNPNWLVCEAIIPSAVGGFNIREVALYDSTGNTMLAIASYPPTYKPTVEEGAAKIQTIRIVIQVDNSGNFELIVDPDVVLATVEYVNQLDKSKTASLGSAQDLKDYSGTAKYVICNGLIYELIIDNSLVENGYSIISSDRITDGKWQLINKNTYPFNLYENKQDLFQNNSKLELNEIYELHETIDFSNFNRSLLQGIGASSGFLWKGSEGIATNKLQWKPILKLFNNQWKSTGAISDLIFRDFTIDVNNKKFVCAIDSRYVTNQSKLDSIKIGNLGEGSIGFYISKSWYNKTRDCSVRGKTVNGKNGIGVFVDTLSEENTVNQVNAVPLDISVHTCDIGYLIDQSRYVYSLNIPSSVTIEHCNVGLKVQGKLNAFVVRNAIISAYFESNGTDVVWGDADSRRDFDSNILWIGASFNDSGSKVILNEGRHTFIGCTGLETLEINNLAEVELINTIVDNITGNSSSARRLARRKSRPSVSVTCSSGSFEVLQPLASKRLSSTGTGTVTFDLKENLFGTNAYWGRFADVKILSRRNYDTSNTSWYDGVLTRNNNGEFYLQRKDGSGSETYTVDGQNVVKNKNYHLNVVVSMDGILSVTSSLGDQKTFEVLINVY